MVVLDNREKNLKFFVRGGHTDFERIVYRIKEFIKKELKEHEKKPIEITDWANLACEIINFDQVSECDSGVFMLRVAYKFALNPHADLNISLFDSFRVSLLTMLYTHGTQVD